jgi:hypothetical protein
VRRGGALLAGGVALALAGCGHGGPKAASEHAGAAGPIATLDASAR